MKIRITRDQWIRMGARQGWDADGISGPRRFWEDDKVLNWFKEHYPKSTMTAEQIIRWFRRNFTEGYSEPFDWGKRKSRDIDPTSL